MAAEDIGALAVSLSLNSDSFTKGMASVERQLKANDAAFKASIAETAKFGTSLETLGNKQQFLQTKLDNQGTALSQYANRLTELGDKMSRLAQSQGEIEKQAEAAKTAWINSAKALRDHKKAADLDEKAMKALREETERLRSEYNTLQGKLDANGRAMDKTQANIEKTQIGYQNMRGAVAETANALDKAKKAYAEQASGLAKMRADLLSAGDAALKLGKSLESIGSGMSRLGGTMMRSVTLPIVAGMTAGVKAAIDYESAFAGVKKTVDATEAEYAQMSAAIVDMSNKMPFAATSIAEVAEAAGQLGIQKNSIISFSETMLKLGTATDLAGTEGATTLARFAAITRMSQKDFDRLGSTIVKLGNNFAATESEIADMGMRISAAGSQVGMSEAEIMGFAAAMKQVGLESQAGGSALSKVMLDIDMKAAKGEGALKKFADVAGMSAKEFSAIWEKDAAGAMVSFIEGLGMVEAKGGNLALTLESLGYKELRVRDALMRAAGASGDVAQAVSMANGAWEENNALQEEYIKRAETMEAKLQVLKNKGTNALAKFGEAAMPTLEKAMNFAGGMIESFAAMDESARESFLFKAGAAALAGPALKVFSTAATGLGKISTGIGNIQKAAATAGPLAMKLATGLNYFLPAIGIIAGVSAALAGLMYAMGRYEREMAQISTNIKEMDLGIDADEIEKVRTAIEDGIEAGKIYATAKAQVDVDFEVVTGKVEKALEDGDLTSKEALGIQKALNKQVDNEIKEAEKYAKQRAEEYATHLKTFTVGNASELSESDYAFVGDIQAIVTDMGGKLKEMNPALTEAEINKIVTLVLKTPIADLDAKLKETGIDDEALRQTIIEATKPGVDAANETLISLGIADEGTRAALIGQIMANMKALGAELGKLGVTDEGTQAEIAEALSAGFGDAKAALMNLQDDPNFTLSSEEINKLALAWVGGTDAWNTALSSLTLPEGMGDTLTAAVSNGFAAQKATLASLSTAEGFGLSESEMDMLAKAWLKGPAEWNTALSGLNITDESTKAALETALSGTGGMLAGIDLAGANPDAIVSAWAKQIGGFMNDAAKTSLLSDETIEALAGSLAEKTKEITAQLDAYRNDYNELVNKMGQKGYTETEAEVARLNQLLSVITELTAQLRLMGDEVYERARASETLVLAGKGTTEDFGRAAGLAKELYEQGLNEIKAEATLAITEANNAVQTAKEAVADAEKRLADAKTEEEKQVIAGLLTNAKQFEDIATKQLEGVLGAEAERVDAAKETYIKSISELFEAMATQYPQEAEKLQEVVTSYNLLAKIAEAGVGTISESDIQENRDAIAEALKRALSFDDQEWLFGENLNALDPQDIIDKLLSGMDSRKIDLEDIEFTNLAGELQRLLMESIQEDMQDVSSESNPLLEMVKGMLESGTLDETTFEGIDTSAIGESLMGVIDFSAIKAGGAEIGKNLLEGLLQGVSDEQGKKSAADAAKLSGDAVTNALKTTFGVQSPSTVWAEIGMNLMQGLQQGMEKSKILALMPLVSLVPKMTSLGGQMIDGLVLGIMSRQSAVVDAMTSIASAAQSAMQSAMEIHSPSRRMAWIGKMIAEGVAVGMDVGRGGVVDAAGRLADAAVPGVKGEYDPRGAGTPGSTTYQYLTVNTPKHLNASETARKLRDMNEQLALGV